MEKACPCGSGAVYADCCEPVIRGTKQAETAEALMRARYSAYAKCEVDFVLKSTHPDQKDGASSEDIKSWSEGSSWLGLEILRTEKGGPDDQEGGVEFMARYTDSNGGQVEHHEVAEFRKKDGEWRFYDGILVNPRPYVRETPKVGPNEPCPCGSGKKYKKCCG